MLHWQKVSMDWRQAQERDYGGIDRRLSPANPMCAICGCDVKHEGLLGWIEIAPGDPRELPKVAVHLDCCGNMTGLQLARVAIEAVPAAVTGRKLKRHPGPIRVKGRKR